MAQLNCMEQNVPIAFIFGIIAPTIILKMVVSFKVPSFIFLVIRQVGGQILLLL